MKVASFDEVLGYRHADLLQCFAEQHSVDLSSAGTIFTETKRLLWLMATQETEIGQTGVPVEIFICGPMVVLDEMWHNFILFTKDYHWFCQRYFGTFLHHAPTGGAEQRRREKERQKDPAAFHAQRQEELRELCLYVGRKLGKDTLKLWFEAFPKRFAQIAPK